MEQNRDLISEKILWVRNNPSHFPLDVRQLDLNILQSLGEGVLRNHSLCCEQLFYLHNLTKANPAMRKHCRPFHEKEGKGKR